MLCEQRARSADRLCGIDIEPEPDQRQGKQLAQVGLVVDDEHGWLAARGGRRGACRIGT